MNKEERALKTIRRGEIDYLPSYVVFSDRTRMAKVGNTMGFKTIDEFDHFLENHFYMTLTLDDVPLFYRNDDATMRDLEERGYARVDWKNNVVYDRWGVGIERYSDGFFPRCHPLQAGKDRHLVEKFMPSDLRKSVLFESDANAIRKYKAPDIDGKDDLFSWMEKDLKQFSGQFLVFPSGYIGVYERAYLLMGYEEFMTRLALDPKLVGILLDKITEYKVEIAKRTVNMGFKIGHYGDDLGGQTSTMMSKDMFRKHLKPRIARIWKVFKDAGLPVQLHSCGWITDFIPDLIDIGLDVLEPTQPVMDLGFLKKEYGKHITFWGGIDTQGVLPKGTPEEVKKLASDTIRILGKGGGYIIGPAQEIMNDVPIENVKALVETIVDLRQKVLHM
jgi:uroporphyrinogen decarboxylase